jgi:putative tricarboxylic transport membrane protein
MRSADLVVAAILALMGGVVIYDAARLGFRWGAEGPQSGFFPFWLAVLLLAMAVAVFVQALVRRQAQPFATRQQIVPVLKVLGPLAAFVVLTDPPGPGTGLGLYVAAALYLGFYMRWVGRHRWVTIFAIAVVVPVVAFVIFEQWFLVPMPKGPLEEWLGY